MGPAIWDTRRKNSFVFAQLATAEKHARKVNLFVDAKYVHRTLCTRRTKFIKSRNPATEKKKSCAYLIIILISYMLDRHPHREEGQGYKIDIKKTWRPSSLVNVDVKN